jgi:hypothetical protein
MSIDTILEGNRKEATVMLIMDGREFGEKVNVESR